MRAILDFFRRLAKRLPYPLFLRVFLITDRLRDGRPARILIKRCGVPLLRPGILEEHKTSEVLFILGSGPSINRISSERWSVIRRHDTVGLNFWLFHPFVPRFYFFESLADWEPGYADYLRWTQRRAPDYAGVVKVASYVWPSGVQAFGQVFTGERNLYAAISEAVPARNAAEMSYAIDYFLRRHAFESGAGRRAFFKHASSLSLLINVAVCMGYKKIVLCGVDLKSQEYFYQDTKLFPESAGLETAPRHLVHATQFPLEWRVPVSTVLELLRDRVLKPRGIELYVEHRGSALWPLIEEVPESLFASGVETPPRRGYCGAGQ